MDFEREKSMPKNATLHREKKQNMFLKYRDPPKIKINK